MSAVCLDGVSKSFILHSPPRSDNSLIQPLPLAFTALLPPPPANTPPPPSNTPLSIPALQLREKACKRRVAKPAHSEACRDLSHDRRPAATAAGAAGGDAATRPPTSGGDFKHLALTLRQRAGAGRGGGEGGGASC